MGWKLKGGCGCRNRAPAKAAPNVCPISGQTSSTGLCPISGQGLKPSGAGGAVASNKGNAKQNGAAAPAEKNGKVTEANAKWNDPLMGAQTEADKETATELKEQGNEKFKGKQYEEALEFYNEAVQLMPRDPSLWLNRSIVNRNLGNWQDADEDAEIASEIQPSNAKAHYSRALCNQQMGKLEKALTCVKAGLEAQSDNAALIQLKNVLKRQLAEKLDERPPASEAAKSKRQGKQETSSKQEKTQQQLAGEEAQEDDPFACPVSKLKDNDIEDIKKEAMNKMYQWQNGNPSQGEREALKRMLTDAFKQKYMELRAQTAAAKSAKPATDQYDKLQKQGLQLKGGHQPMPRPDNVDLPPDYKDPMGVIDMDTLKKYSFQNPGRRYFISVYGNVFDVSDRPDKYGPDGPYTILTGADITWGLFAGVDTEDYVNRCYDLFKAKDMGKDKIAGVCSWLAWYWVEYGDPVGHLDLYQSERDLPAPPLEEVDEACVVM